MSKIVIESPLAGDTAADNFRYLLWCCRAVWEVDDHHAIASHMLNPWFMDDSVPEERQAGIDNEWVWSEYIPHWFFIDLGLSRGMQLASERCSNPPGASPCAMSRVLTLHTYAPESWAAYKRGEWPPHTAGFEVAE